MATTGDPLASLTAREREVLDLLRLGLPDSEIAQRLGISTAGVSYHVSEIIGKLGVRDRYEAAAWPDSPPWWTKALVPFVVLWRKMAAASNSAALAAIGASALLLIGGVVLMTTLLLRTHTDADHNDRAHLAGSTKPPDFVTFVAVVARSTPTEPALPPIDTPQPAPIDTPVPDTATEVPSATPASDATLTPEFLQGMPPGTRLIGSCVIPPNAVEVFPPEAAAHGQRIFDAPGERWYLKSDGSCVDLLWIKGGPTPPDYAPDDIPITVTPLPGPV
jgi:DNA-binding CsgD family transcriptional regulator